MKQIGNSNEDMLTLLETVTGIKNELLYIREYFHPLLKGETYLSGEQVCEMLHISKRTLQQYGMTGSYLLSNSNGKSFSVKTILF